mmetsp:Transcript_46414/g.145237  ORF Transcript_46414/g.145237 Transcript_46414/m.145237 type:complete len:202 (-) Transcript_46414:1061-1666(-)
MPTALATAPTTEEDRARCDGRIFCTGPCASLCSVRRAMVTSCSRCRTCTDSKMVPVVHDTASSRAQMLAPMKATAPMMRRKRSLERKFEGTIQSESSSMSIQVSCSSVQKASVSADQTIMVIGAPWACRTTMVPPPRTSATKLSSKRKRKKNAFTARPAVTKRRSFKMKRPHQTADPPQSRPSGSTSWAMTARTMPMPKSQ